MADVEMDIMSTRMNNGNEHVKEDLETNERSGNEDSGDLSEEEGEEEQAGPNGEKTEEGSKQHSSSSGKHKRKKHKHRSKHKKHKHANEEDKDRKRKHRHKHRKHKRKEVPSPADNAAGHRKMESSPSSGNPSLDDRAVLEDLEKQRAMIKAELDSQLMEGKVQSGMGLILQGYKSGSEEDAEARFRNGEQRPRGSSGKLISPRGERSGKSRRNSTDGSKSGSKRRSKSKSADKPAKEAIKDKGTKSNKEAKERGRARSRSKDRKQSGSTDRFKEKRKSNSPPSFRNEQKVSRLDKRSSPQREDRPNTDRASRRSRSPVRERPSRPDADRDKRQAKSPSKDTSLGKENRSPHRRGLHSPTRRRSASPRHRDTHRTSMGASDRTSKHSPPRRSPPRRARSRSPEARRREADRQDSPLRKRSRADAGPLGDRSREKSPTLASRRRLSRSPLRRRSPSLPRRSRSSPRRRSRSPLRRRSGERDRYGRLRQYRRSISRDRGRMRRRRRSRDEDKFKGSLSEGMKVDQDSSDDEMLDDFEGEEIDEEALIEQRRQQRMAIVQKYKTADEEGNMGSEPSSPQSSTRSRSPSPDDILERVAADVKEYERENLNTFEASIKAKHNLIAQEKDGKVLVEVTSVGIQSKLNEPISPSST